MNTTTAAVMHEATGTEGEGKALTERRKVMAGRAALAIALRAFFSANEVVGESHEATGTEVEGKALTERRKAVAGRAALAIALRAFFSANEAAGALEARSRQVRGGSSGGGNPR